MSDLTKHWRKLYDNKYLGAWNLFDDKAGVYRELHARIESANTDVVVGEGGRKDQPLQLVLVGARSGVRYPPMIVTRTNGTTLQKMFGEIPANWVGKTITLYVRKNKKAQRGTGDVLTVRSTNASDSMKEELRPRVPDIAPDELVNAEDSREPGQEG